MTLLPSEAREIRSLNRSWFSVFLAYATDITNDELSLEIDLWLFRASDIEEARATALNGAFHAEDMGRAFLAGPGAVATLGFSELAYLLLELKRTGLTLPGERNPMYQFVGIRDLWEVGPRLTHGTVVGTYRQGCCTRDQPAVGSKDHELFVFEQPEAVPLGKRDADDTIILPERQKWYLGEQLFCRLDHADRISRFVLISAANWVLAYEASIVNAKSAEVPGKRAFVSLQQLSLIMDLKGEACILRTDEVIVPIDRLMEALGDHKLD